MKMALLAALAALPLSAAAFSARTPAPAAPVANYSIDSGHSGAVFRVKHLVAPFWGRFNKIEGSVSWDAAAPDKSTVEVAIDAASVDTNNRDRDEHLRGPDFFGAKEFPKITFKSTKVVKKAEGKLEVTGDFTMRGVTKSITVPVEVVGEGKAPPPLNDHRAGFEATFDIKRSDYKVESYLEMIGDDTRIIVALECVKK
jgi:polyisoprenoid-binding protein YceI